MKKIASLFLVLFVCFQAESKDFEGMCFTHDTASINGPLHKNSLEDRIIGLSKIWSEVKYNFANIDRITFDLDSLYEATLPKVIAARDDIEYYYVLQRFLSAMNDGHTELVQYTYNWNDVFDYIPSYISEFDEKFYFTSIRKDANINHDLLYAEITEIHNLPTMQYVEENLFATISASTYNSKLKQASVKLMQGFKGTELIGKAKKLNGEMMDFSIIRNGEATRSENDEYLGIRSKYPQEKITLRWVDKIAILQINTFSHIEMNDAIDSLADIIHNSAKGLIIDLRWNGGGITSVARHLQMYLTHSDSIRSFGAQKRVNDSYGRAQGNYREMYQDYYLSLAYEDVPYKLIKVEEGIIPFDIPVVVLMGRYSFSACEDFLVNIYEMPDRPVLIGEATAGSTGAPLMIPLPNGAIARVCSIRITYPYSGKPFAGCGVQPDIEIKQTLYDFIQGKDTEEEFAIKYLKDQL